MQFKIDLKSKLQNLVTQLRTYLQPGFQSKLWAGERGNPSHLNYLSEIDDERNQFLWDILLGFQASSIVEIGSSLGSKIIGLARSNPEIKIVGLDINQKAVAKGLEIANAENLRNLTFLEFDAGRNDFKKLSVELKSAVIFSWATLIYIHPSKISRLLKLIVDSQVLGFVFIEQHATFAGKFSKKGRLVDRGPNYVRDYGYLLNQIEGILNYKVDIFPIGQSIWSPGGGKQSVIIGKRLN